MLRPRPLAFRPSAPPRQRAPLARALAVLAACSAVLAAACGDATVPPLPLHGDASALPAADREQLTADLERFFGTARAPRFAALDGWEAAGFDPDAAAPTGRSDELAARIADDNAERWHAALRRAAAGEDPVADAMPDSLVRALDGLEGAAASAAIRAWQPDLAESARRFDRECATCHGRAGGGDGPSSIALDPVPRDFRSGTFVHRAVGPNPRPTQSDLVRVQQRGIAGTGMPLFARLGAARQSGLADWVRYLSLRGEFERAWLDHRAAFAAPPSDDEMRADYAEAWSRWAILPDRRAATDTDPTRATSNDDPR